MHDSLLNFHSVFFLDTLYMKKFLDSDWLRAAQFFRNTVQKMKYSANFLIF